MRTVCPKGMEPSKDGKSLRLRTDCPKLGAMSQITSFRSVIELWGPKDAWGAREALAADVGATASQVSKWWQRDSIPAEWWASLLASDKAKSNEVTAERLTRFAAREALEARA